MLNELGPFALLMHHFTENVNEFRKLTISREEFQGFKDLVSSTITQAICGYNQDQERKKRAMKLYDEIYNGQKATTFTVSRNRDVFNISDGHARALNQLTTQIRKANRSTTGIISQTFL